MTEGGGAERTEQSPNGDARGGTWPRRGPPEQSPDHHRRGECPRSRQRPPQQGPPRTRRHIKDRGIAPTDGGVERRTGDGKGEEKSRETKRGGTERTKKLTAADGREGEKEGNHEADAEQEPGALRPHTGHPTNTQEEPRTWRQPEHSPECRKTPPRIRRGGSPKNPTPKRPGTPSSIVVVSRQVTQ